MGKERRDTLRGQIDGCSQKLRKQLGRPAKYINMPIGELRELLDAADALDRYAERMRELEAKLSAITDQSAALRQGGPVDDDALDLHNALERSIEIAQDGLDKTESEQCPNCGGAKPCVREDCGEPERSGVPYVPEEVKQWPAFWRMTAKNLRVINRSAHIRVLDAATAEGYERCADDLERSFASAPEAGREPQYSEGHDIDTLERELGEPSQDETRENALEYALACASYEGMSEETEWIIRRAIRERQVPQEASEPSQDEALAALGTIENCVDACVPDHVTTYLDFDVIRRAICERRDDTERINKIEAMGRQG